MFWGLIVYTNKKYSSTVGTPFHVSQAVLDTSSVADNTEVRLFLECRGETILLCNLRKPDIAQATLNLNFSEGDVITFGSVGGTVHLTGYSSHSCANRIVNYSDSEELSESSSSSDTDQEMPSTSRDGKWKVNGHEVKQEGTSSESATESIVSDSDSDEESDHGQPDPSKRWKIFSPKARQQKKHSSTNGVRR